MVKIIVKTKDGGKHKMIANDWPMAYRAIRRLKKKGYKKMVAFGSDDYKVTFKKVDHDKD